MWSRPCNKRIVLSKFGIDSVYLYLKIFFYKLFDVGYYHDVWSKGQIEKGDATKAENYSGITMLNALCKLFTKILYYRKMGKTKQRLYRGTIRFQIGYVNNNNGLD